MWLGHSLEYQRVPLTNALGKYQQGVDNDIKLSQANIEYFRFIMSMPCLTNAYTSARRSLSFSSDFTELCFLGCGKFHYKLSRFSRRRGGRGGKSSGIFIGLQFFIDFCFAAFRNGAHNINLFWH